MKISKYYTIHFNMDEKYANFNSTTIKLSDKEIILNDLSKITNHYHLIDEIIKQMGENLESNRIEDLKNIKTLYRYPGISLSRDRVGLYCEKTGLKMVRDKNSADARVISKKIIEKTMDVTYNETDFVTFNKLIELVEDPSAGLDAFQNIESMKSFQNDLKDYLKENNISGDAFVTCPCTHYYNSQWDNTVDKLVDSTKIYRDTQKVEYVSHFPIKVKDKELFNEFCTGSFKWLMDDDCNKIMSDTSVPINDEMFIQLKNMLKSGSRDDLGVAMTMMANAKIEGSETYLGMIFFHFGEKMKGTKVWNQVGFKSLRLRVQKYYDSTNYNYGHAARYDKMIRMLIEDDALTVPAMEHILDLVFHAVVKEATGLSSCDVFRLERSSISLTPEYREKATNQSLSKALGLSVSNELPF